MFYPVYFANVITENEMTSSPIAYFRVFILEVLNDQTNKIHCVLEMVQGVPLATEPGISLIMLTQMKILQRNLNRITFIV
jgi:hypothetical protein